ncbi:MAG TPA: DUF2167 domain-containing protein [Parvularcula sp.]|nr:DUF2167 domain-containing protein [Parvularcula sp.]
MKSLLCAASVMTLVLLSVAAAEEAEAPAAATTEGAGDALAGDGAATGWSAEEQAFLDKLDRKTGAVKIGAAKATLNVPETLYFLDAEDARAVLEEAWGNPPDESTLGMILPAGATPLDDGVWAATISFSDEGYVSDDDAGKINYDELMASMQEDARASNAWRDENGYPKVDLVGWAEPPTYDAGSHKLYWAKELKFGESEVNTLNYDIRVLGRSGVLVIGFIADMNALPEIRAAAPEVLSVAAFDEGARYADYQHGVDKKAAYGLAGLITGGVIAKKAGLFAAIAIFAKKFVGIIVAGLVAAAAYVRKFFKKPG